MPASSDPHRAALLAALWARTTGEGTLSLACMPAALEDYVGYLAEFFELLGKPLAADEIEQIRKLLTVHLTAGFRESSGTAIEVRYKITSTPTLKKNLELRFALRAPNLSQQFAAWTEKRSEVLFGQHPDARVLAVIEELGVPAPPILDVGAGDGRNAVPLARRGWSVDAVELADHFCERLRNLAVAESLPIRVIPGDICTSPIDLPRDHYAFAFACEVVSHFRRGPGLKTYLARMAATLRPGGKLLFNIFLPRDTYVPDEFAFEMSEVSWATLFSREELAQALKGLPLRQVDEVSVYDFEKANLPVAAWPPTGWFEAWTRGYSIFPVESPAIPPVQMYWLLFERMS